VDPIRWTRRPALRHPVLILAFEGWNDAADAASGAVTFLARSVGARAVGHLDPEEFYDFTTVRPEVRPTNRIGRRIRWPRVRIAAARLPDAHRDALLVWGPEPQLRWRTFSASLLGLARELEVEMVVELGAMLADVAHSRPVRVTGSAPTRELTKSLGLLRSRYEGPTGILGVLGDTFDQAGIPTVSLWANVPHYVPQGPSPKATLALVGRVAELLGISPNTLELELAAAAYERQVNELVAADDEVAAYVGHLEDDPDDEADELDADRNEADDGDRPRLSEPHPADLERLTSEVERFLRRQSGDGGA
jgi:hypothetical protein